MTDNTRDIVIRLDAEMTSMKKQLDSVESKVSEMHALLQQARGARWAIFAMAALGGFVSAKLSFLFPWFK